MSEPELRRRRARRIAATAVAVALIGLVVSVGAVALSRYGEGDPAASTPKPSPTRSQSLDLSDLPIERGPFCDALSTSDVEKALGASVSATGHYDSGERVRLTARLRDLSHEFNCTFSAGSGARARAWVFAAPVTRPVAAMMAREARAVRGCRAVPAAATFGTPTASTECQTPGGRAVTLQGLFGDTWLSCRLTTPTTQAAPDTARRAEQWCVRVATTLGARP